MSVATRPTVMVVDDEPDHLGLLTAHLHRAGCTVLAMADAERALALPANLPVHLIVLDLRLPGIDGWKLTGALRGRYPECPIVISSVLDIDAYPDADGVLPKPVTRARVQHLVDLLIHGRADHGVGRR